MLQSECWCGSCQQSAKNLIDAKCRNMTMLLKRYLGYRKIKFPDQAKIIEKNILLLNKERTALQSAKQRAEIMLAEARGARAYWTSFALLSHCPTGWHRIHPGATDPWNQALNIGYTMLADFLRPLITNFGFSLEIGILHAPESGDEPLVYDFEELFRQPLVDSCLLPLFARTNEYRFDKKSILNKLRQSFEKPIRYSSQNMKPRTVVQNELYAFRRALSEQAAYKPYRHSWAHRTK